MYAYMEGWFGLPVKVDTEARGTRKWKSPA